MTIIWNKVTTTSQIVAIVLFVGIFYLGYVFGKEVRSIEDTYTSTTVQTR
ncbi:MAG: hypothetical protein WAX38_04930 [Minisyncoccia bacterium]